MLRLPATELPARALSQLRRWQAALDGQADFPTRVADGKRLFGSRNSRTNATFAAVKAGLRTMQGDLVRCAYCEDSVADEVEHIYPKDTYPGKVFLWENYTYACGPCNGPKNNKFAVFRADDGSEIDVTPPHSSQRPAGWLPTPPPDGDPLLIDPRSEDPLDFLWLDLGGTFRIDPLLDLPPRENRRAEYTCELLDLNRDFLLRARRNVFTAMRSMLGDIADEKEDANRPGRIAELKDAMLGFVHQTVWAEIVRQHAIDAELDTLFARVPEALTWKR